MTSDLSRIIPALLLGLGAGATPGGARPGAPDGLADREAAPPPPMCTSEDRS